jgi:hypothetical protein
MSFRPRHALLGSLGQLTAPAFRKRGFITEQFLCNDALPDRRPPGG